MRSLFAVCLLACLPLTGQQGQRFAEIKELRLDSGAVLGSCRTGFRTYGVLNPEGDNAIVFPTWFTGKSGDLESYIGPGKLVDTRRFFVVAVDALANGVSSSPSNTPGGFPRVSVGDMVRAQYRLLTEHLGVKRLHAAIGISMGGMQVFEWITAYPGFVARAVPVIGSPRLNSSDLLLWQAQLSAIEAAGECGCDPRKMLAAVDAMHQFALRTPAWQAANTSRGDFARMAQTFGKSPGAMDPRDRAAQLRAMMDHDVSRGFGGSMEKAAGAVRASVLVVAAAQDHMVHPGPALEFARLLQAQVVLLEGDCGHMAPGCESDRMTPAVKSFLER
jgi:homoserine O-acetyltransferase